MAIHDHSPFMLALDASTAPWLAAALAISGLALLGLLVFFTFRSRTNAADGSNRTTAEEDLDRLKRAGDRMSLLTAAAERTADALDERIVQLEVLLGVADERIASLDSAPDARARTSQVDADLGTAGSTRPVSLNPSSAHVETKPQIGEAGIDPFTRAV